MISVVLLDHLGVAVFAISGALAAADRRLDIFGAVVLATITAVGGGTLRDLVLGNTPVFWVEAPSYIVVATAATLFTFVYTHWRPVNRAALATMDAFGLGLFSVLGANLADELGFTTLICIVMGVLTGVFGGIARDVLANKVPLVLREEVYATAAMAGAGMLMGLKWLGVPTEIALLAAGSATVTIRLLALRYHLSLPLFPQR